MLPTVVTELLSYLYHFVSVVHTNSSDELGGKDILVEPEHQRCFTTGGISDHEKPNNVRALGAHL